MSVFLQILQIVLGAAPELVQAIEAYHSGTTDASNPIHVQVASILDKAKADLEAAK